MGCGISYPSGRMCRSPTIMLRGSRNTASSRRVPGPNSSLWPARSMKKNGQVVFLRWGLLDTALGLILAHLTMALPVAAWVLTTTFSSIPREVQEAAAVDGCGTWRTLTSIILPLALPGLAVCGLLVWLLSWEEFTLATYLTLGAKTMPLQVYYYLYQGNWFDTAVAATLMTLPVLVLSAFLQRYLRETSLAGVMR